MGVERLITFAWLDGPVTGTYWVHLLLVAQLEDGPPVILLADRGFGGDAPVEDRARLEETARTCVGPDEPADGRDADQEERQHWEALADVLAAAGVRTSGGALGNARHDVVLDEALAAMTG